MFSIPRIRLAIPVAVVTALALVLALPAFASADFSLTIEPEGSGTGTVECEVEAGPVEACENEYPEGTDLALVPEADPGSEFVEFSGDCGPAECELTMDENHAVAASFELEAPEEFTLTAETAGSGTGTIECEVEAGPAEACEDQYPEGTELTLLAEADPGSEFVEWVGDCGPAECELTMDEDHEAIAIFELEPVDFLLTLEFEGSGSGTVLCEAQEGPEACQAEYPEGTELTLLAEADPGSEFVEFSGDCGPAECELVMNEEHVVSAIFEALEAGVPLNVDTEGTGTGTVKCKVGVAPAGACAAEYAEGTEVELIPTADPGSEFIEWEEDCTGSGSCVVTMNEEKSVIAIFDLEPVTPKFKLTINKAGTGSGTVTSSPAGINCGVDCEEEYNEGTEVTLSTSATAGSKFVSWAGCASEPEPGKCKVTMSAAKEVTVTFDLIPKFKLKVKKSGTGTGTVTSSPAGINCGVTCEAEFEEGKEVTLSTSATAGSEFVSWAGCASEPEPGKCKVTMSAAKEVTVTFDLEPVTPKFKLTINKAGTGSGTVTSSPAGINCGVTCEAEFEEGKEVTLSTSATAGSKFVSWAGCASEPEPGKCKVTMSAAKEVTVTFNLIPKFNLKVKKIGTGTGTVTSSPAGINCGVTCEAEFEEGKEVTLSTSATAGSKFVSWAGCASEPEPGKCKVTMSAAKEVTVTFDLEPVTPKFKLKVKKSGTGTGTVTSSPAGINCGVTCEAEFEEGKEVTLSTSATAGSEFVSWAGCASEPEPGKCKVTMSAAKEVTVTFDLEPVTPKFKLTINKAGTGSGSVTCDGGACAAEYEEGKEVTLAASAASGSSFAGWSGGGCSGTGTCKVTITADTTVTATFNASSTPPPPPPPPVEGKVKAAASASVSGGKAALKLTCSGGPCKGTLKLTAKVKQGKKTKNVVIGQASFNLASGASATLKVKLSGAAKKELSKGKTLKAKTSGTGVTASTVKIKPAKKKS